MVERNSSWQIKDKEQNIILQVKQHGTIAKVTGVTTQPDSTLWSHSANKDGTAKTDDIYIYIWFYSLRLALKMEIQLVLKMAFDSALTWLIDQEHFMHCDSFKYYTETRFLNQSLLERTTYKLKPFYSVLIRCIYVQESSWKCNSMKQKCMIKYNRIRHSTITSGVRNVGFSPAYSKICWLLV
jgi:hypothetical protein